MEKMLANRKLLMLLTAAVMIVVGIVSFVMTVQRAERVKAGKYQEAVATISRIDTIIGTGEDPDEHTVYVNYTAGGTSHGDVILSDYDPGMYEGSQIQILYNVDDYTDIMLPSGKNPLMGYLVSGAFVLAGIVSGIRALILKN